MSYRIDTEADLANGLIQLVEADPRFKAVIAISGTPPLRRRPGGFAGLVSIVVSQQLSTTSASAIWARITDAYDPLEPGQILRARATRLAKLGLSGPKIRTLRAIATAVDNGTLDLAALAEGDADVAHAVLTAVHGIGPWTADIYLLTCLGHSDAWPAGDLALQEATRLAFNLDARPTAKAMAPIAEPWRPWRGVAARVLWSYYRAVKRREGAPVVAAADPAANPNT
jgi:DNA-3-methyladenine glycosylase II